MQINNPKKIFEVRKYQKLVLLLLSKRALNLKSIISYWCILRAYELITSHRVSHKLLLIRSFKYFLAKLSFVCSFSFSLLSLPLSISIAWTLRLRKSIFSQEQKRLMPGKLKPKIAWAFQKIINAKIFFILDNLIWFVFFHHPTFSKPM